MLTEPYGITISLGRPRCDTYSIKLPKYIKMSVDLEIKFEPDQIKFDFDYIAINNLNIVDKKTSE